MCTWMIKGEARGRLHSSVPLSWYFIPAPYTRGRSNNQTFTLLTPDRGTAFQVPKINAKPDLYPCTEHTTLLEKTRSKHWYYTLVFSGFYKICWMIICLECIAILPQSSSLGINCEFSVKSLKIRWFRWKENCFHIVSERILTELVHSICNKLYTLRSQHVFIYT